MTIGVGQTANLTAEALDASNNVLTGKSFVFTSDNTAIATVADAAANPATVTAMTAGIATITATTEGKSGQASVTVTERPDIQLTGRVIDGETQAGIGSATVDYATGVGGGNGTTLTDADGDYSFALPAYAGQQVSVTARATGYVRTTLHQAAFQAPSTQLETILLVRQTTSLGLISGTVRNARTIDPITGARVVLRTGQGTGGDEVAERISDPEGRFSFTGLVAGTYTLRTTADGFSPSTRAAITVLSDSTTVQDVLLSPLSNTEIRIVLTWGPNPKDLDSHLTGPADGTNRFHIYYESRGSFDAPPFAGLDVDEVSGTGPETITITRLNAGTYRYSVHDYSNRGSATSTALGSSSAKVELYYVGGGPRVFYVPNQPGTLWTVFELSGDIVLPTVTPRNTMGFQENPGGVLARLPDAKAGNTTDRQVIEKSVRDHAKAAR